MTKLPIQEYIFIREYSRLVCTLTNYHTRKICIKHTGNMKYLGSHSSLCSRDDAVFAQSVCLDCQVVLDVFTRLPDIKINNKIIKLAQLEKKVT